jgi:hypothetical protein
MGVLKSQFLTTRWPKFFFSARNRFFWVNNAREVKKFVSTTVVLSFVLLVRSLTIWQKYSKWSLKQLFLENFD